jgi:hypothetical protein
MVLERTLFSVNVSETTHDRNYWSERPWVTEALNCGIREADVLVVPWEGTSPESPVFPQQTREIIKALRTLATGKVSVVIDSNSHSELAQHGNELKLPTLLVTAILLPVVAHLVGSRIEKWIFEHHEPATTVEMEVIVEGHRGKCISIKYKGPPGRLVETLIDETNKCFGTKEKSRRGP